MFIAAVSVMYSRRHGMHTQSHNALVDSAFYPLWDGKMSIFALSDNNKKGQLSLTNPRDACEQWRFYVGARGAQAPQILPRLPKFLDTVVLLLVELIGSITS